MPTRRLITIALLVLSAVAVASPIGATAQESGPGELWRAFPLDPQTTAPTSPAAPAPSSPAPAATESEDGDGGLILILWLAAAVAALVALELFFVVRRTRRGRTEAYPAPAPAPAAPSPSPSTRVEAGAPELARLAADYIEIVSSGSRRPVVDLAARRSSDVERTRRALQRARARGLLVSEGRGKVGGTLSDEARRLLGASATAVAQPDDELQPGPRFVDRAHLVADEPGEPDLADDVLGDVGRHAGGALRPRDPETPVGQNGRVNRR